MSDSTPPKNTPLGQRIEEPSSPFSRQLGEIANALLERKERPQKPFILHTEEAPTPRRRRSHSPSDAELQACITEYGKPPSQKP